MTLGHRWRSSDRSRPRVAGAKAGGSLEAAVEIGGMTSLSA
jgi:hypothetical protein